MLRNKIKTNIKHDEKKEEDKHLHPFLKFYCDKYHEDIASLNTHNLDKGNDNIKSPDYLIPELGIVIEIKEVHDEVLKNFRSNWEKDSKKLQELIENNNCLQGLHIKTNHKFNVPNSKKKLKKIKAALLGKNYKELNKHGIPEIREISGDKLDLGISYVGQFASFDPVGNAKNFISKHLINVNEKFFNARQNYDSPKSIFLLVHSHPLIPHENIYYQAVFELYNQIFCLDNIDEIWLMKDSDFFQLYNREHYTAFLNEDVEKLKSDIKLLQLYFIFFKEDKKHQIRLFNILKNILENKFPHEVFPMADARLEMFFLGEHFQWEEFYWLLSKFKDDPDPKVKQWVVDIANQNQVDLSEPQPRLESRGFSQM